MSAYIVPVQLEGSAPAFPPPRSSATYRVESRFGESLHAATAPSPAAPAANTYTVQPGDNLTGIVQRQLQSLGQPSGSAEVYGRVREIARHNGLRNPDRLSVGQRLDLSPLGNASTSSPYPAAPASAPVVKIQPPEPSSPPTGKANHEMLPLAPVRESRRDGLPVQRMGGKVFRHVSRQPSRATDEPLQLARDERPHVLVPSTAYDKNGMGGPAPADAGLPLRGYREPGNLVMAMRRVLRSDESRAAETAAVDTKVTFPGEPWSRPLHDPARITSGFGMRRDPFTGRPAFHKGVDLAAKPGTHIYPIADGVVKFSGWQGGYGRVVIVEHADGLESVYAHNSDNLVTPGQTVRADMPIAKVGSTGRSTGPHLHFEVRRDGRAVDPMPHLH